MAQRYSPWQDAADRHGEVHIERCELAPVSGAWVPSQQVILLGRHLDRTGRRSTLAHEIAHIDLEHEPTGHEWFDRRCERDADRLAAMRLVDVVHLADALVEHPLHPGRVADHLEVPLRLLRRRLEQLTEQETAYIDERLSAIEATA